MASSTFPIPQSYGKDCRALFFSDREVTNLNHGSFGAIPEPVQRSCEALTRKIEMNPDFFIRMELFDRQTAARRSVAGLIGASDPDTCVFIPNVSTAMNTVLKSFEWSNEDYIVCTNVIFPSILLAVNSTKPVPNVSPLDLGELNSSTSIASHFRNHIAALKTEIQSRCGMVPTKNNVMSPKVVVIIESISATPALCLPWKEIVNICHQEDVWSVVDAAHSLGQETELNVDEVNPDFWMTDCAKWYYAMRGCAVLYVAPRNQSMISSLVPGVQYPMQGPSPSRFVHTFFWSGMTDPVATLSIEFAIAFRQRLGGERKINEYCHNLAVNGGRLLAERLGTSVMDESEDAQLTANMTNVRLPISSNVLEWPAVYFQFDDEMMLKHRIYAPTFYYREQWWVRASAQVYNDLSDFERLAAALNETCHQINQLFLVNSEV